jgi:hypothetical protein
MLKFLQVPEPTILTEKDATMCCENTSSLYSELTDGIFAMLPNEMRIEIFQKMVESHDWTGLRAACRVSWQWNVEIEALWAKYCQTQQFLSDEKIWASHGKDWKWLSQCMTRQFDKQTALEGTGYGVSGPNGECVGEVKYEGEWVNGQKTGVGRMWWNNGDRYLGHWSADSKDGQGSMLWANGDSYHGGWSHDLRHGSKCEYNYSNGGRYVGEYVNDERHGAGAFHWPNGDVFRGVWANGGRSGQGELTLVNGTVIPQVWNESPYSNYSDTLPSLHPSSLPTPPSVPLPH